MIKSFYVENYCSIRDRVNISFEASKLSDMTSYENIVHFRQFAYLKVVSFYGANASGKSSIIKALAALSELIAPNKFFLQDQLPYFPFIFSDKTKHAPAKMGIEFSINNDSSPLYKYEISFNQNAILFEKLEKFSSQKPALLFLREEQKNNVSTITFGASIQNNPLFLQLGNSLIKNRTFLSMFVNIKVEDFYDAFSFFNERLINISPEVTRFDDLSPVDYKNNERLKDFSEKLLKAADFDINGIEIKKRPIKYMPVPGLVQTIEQEGVMFNHQGQNCGGQIQFINESLGTKKILIIAKHLYQALEKPSVLVIDELESSLHPDLAKLIVEIFLDETINKHNSQLIFTSHNAALLDLSLFRREQINFVYKDKKECCTFIKSLRDFHVRKSDSIDKSYLSGRFDTSPEVKRGIL